MIHNTKLRIMIDKKKNVSSFRNALTSNITNSFRVLYNRDLNI